MPWGLAAAALGGAMGLYGARKQNKAADAQSARQMAFQERMSNTAYQRSAKDLEAAGLNRILALGSPASSPGGAQAPVVNQGTSALQGAQGLATVNNLAASTRLTNATTQKSLDDNYIKHNAINALRSVAKGDKSKPSSAKDENVQPGFIEKYITGPPPDWSAKNNKGAAPKADTAKNPFDSLRRIGPLPPVYGDAEKRAEYQRNTNSKNALRSRKRDAYNKWLDAKKRTYAESQAWKKAHPLDSFKK